MKKLKVCGIGLILSFLSLFNILIPNVLRAELFESKIQTEKSIKTVLETLKTSLVKEEIIKYGLDESEAQRLINAFTDIEFIDSLSKIENILLNKRLDKAKKHSINMLMKQLKLTFDKHADDDLKIKLTNFHEQAHLYQNIITSELSDGRSSNKLNIYTLQREITLDKLVTMGTNEANAFNIVDKLSKIDLDRIFDKDIHIEYAAGYKMGKGLAWGLIIAGSALIASAMGSEGSFWALTAGGFACILVAFWGLGVLDNI